MKCFQKKTSSETREWSISDRKIPKAGARLKQALRCNGCHRVRGHFASKLAFGNRFGFKTCKALETFLFLIAKKKKSFYNFKRKKTCQNFWWFILIFLPLFPPFLLVKQHRISRSETSFKWCFTRKLQLFSRSMQYFEKKLVYIYWRFCFFADSKAVTE